jgi:serine/threonine protein kinase
VLVDAVATVEAPSDRLLGTVVAGKYALVGLLGRGAFGHVYRAWHEVLDREVAVKIIRRSKAQGAAFRERFFLEARAVARLRGANIVTLHDFGEEADGRLYMVLELVAGTNLRQAVPNGARLEPTRAARLMLPVLRALAHAHAQGVVHRDLKPSNLMLTSDDEGQETVKVLDFGVAKLLDVDVDASVEGSEIDSGSIGRVTNHGQVLGTPRYVSPEQAAGADVGPTSDLYSVGVVLYELMAGRAPFQGATPVETARLRILEPAPPLPDDVGASPALAAVVERVLARLPEDRFPTAAAFAAALRACPELTPGFEGPPGTPVTGTLTAVIELHGDASSDFGLSATGGPDSQEDALADVERRERHRRRRTMLVVLTLCVTIGVALFWMLRTPAGAPPSGGPDSRGTSVTPPPEPPSHAAPLPPRTATPPPEPPTTLPPPEPPTTPPPTSPPSRRAPRPSAAPATHIPYL